MADLRVNDIDPELLAKLKIAAINAGKSLRQFVIDLLTTRTQDK
jgi:predicted HicB family RNase H-like nuclease